MRRAIIVMTLVGSVSSILQAQPPMQPAAPQQKLDEILLNWEKAMTGIHSLVADCKRTTVDHVFKSTEVYEGKAKFQKPNRASLHMDNKTKPGVFERYIINGNLIYQYALDAKEIRVHKLPPPKPGQLADDNFLSFLFGMKSIDAKKRYQINLLPAPKGHENWYYYLEIVPRNPTDKAEFAQARMVLWIKNHMPLQLWFREPNGNEITWDFPKLETNVQLPPQEFNQPTPPPGWMLRPMQAETPPRVFRQ
jgi:TIGR03009 family protein